VLEFARSVLRSWRIVAACAVACVTLTAIYLALATPLYTAEAMISVQRQTPRILDMEALLAEGIGNESDYYRTQRLILSSRALASVAIRDLDLGRDPSFVQMQASGGLLARGIAAIGRAFQRDLPDVAAAPADVDPAVISRYQSALEVSPGFRTRLIRVAFTSPDPELARRAVEAHVKAYVRYGVRIRNEASEEARSFLETKVIELKDRLEASEVALNAYRRDTGMVSLDAKENLVVERLAMLNDQLAAAEAERIKREAAVKGLESGNLAAVPQVANNSLIQSLEREIAALEANYLALASQFKPTYPAAQRARTRLDEMQRQLEDEMQRIAGSLQAGYRTALEEEKRLRDRLGTQKAKALELKDASVGYAILQRESDSHRGLYESVLDRVKELGISAVSQTSNVTVLEPAVTPRSPSSPRPLAAVLLALFGGLGGGIAFVLGRDLIDSSLDTPEEVEQLLRVPSLGVIPELGALTPSATQRGLRRAPSGDSLVADDVRLPALAADDPPRLSAEAAAVMAESYRSCRTGILFSRPDAPPKTVLFSSALPFEGKTTSVLNIAIAFHQQNERVLVIDADLRMPKCHTGLRLANGEGLAEVLTGQQPFADVVQRTHREGLHLLSAGRRPPNPTELLGSQTMLRVLEEAMRDYDHVLIDTPPIMAVSDAVVLAPWVEGVILVLKAHATPRAIVERAEARLRHARASILGVLLNHFDARRDSYSTSYGGKYYAPYYGPDDLAGD
jgi:capsular exopolysaccharide synthesis family protein